jgi:nitrate reductase NapE component
MLSPSLSRLSWIALVAVLAAAAALFAVWFAELPGFFFWLGVTTMGTLAILAIVWSVRVQKDALSPLALSAVFYFLTFAGGAVYFWFHPAMPGFNARPVGDRDHLPVAVWLATTAWVLFVAGYVGNPLRLVASRIPASPRLVSIRSPWSVLVVLLVVGWFARLQLFANGLYFHTAVEVEEAGGATWFIRTFSTLPLVALAFAGAWGYLRGERPQAAVMRKAFWVLFVLEAVYALPTGERGMLVALSLIFLSVRYYGSGGRVPWKGMLASGLVLLLFVFPFIESYRGDGGYQSSPTQHLAKAQERTFSGRGADELLDQGFAAAMQRFNGVTSLVMMSYSDRNWFTREPGETLGWIPFGFVPRAFFPDKADPGLFGNEFGRSHAIIDSRDEITAITPLQNGELYLNFGWLGVLFGMPIVGGLYRLFGDYLRRRREEPGTLAVYAVLSWPIISAHEAILAVGVVGVIKTMLIYGLVLFLVERLAQAPSRALVTLPRTGSAVP